MSNLIVHQKAASFRGIVRGSTRISDRLHGLWVIYTDYG